MTFAQLLRQVEEKETVYSAQAFCAGFVTGMQLWDNMSQDILGTLTSFSLEERLE